MNNKKDILEKEQKSITEGDENSQLIDEIKQNKEKQSKKSFFHYLFNPLNQDKGKKWSFSLGGLIDAYKEYKAHKGKIIEKYSAYETVVEGATDTIEYYVLLILSCLIATLGLFQNSAAVIIGAMIVAPLMGPIFGFSAGILWGSSSVIWEAVTSLIKGVALVLGVTAFLSFLTPGISVTQEMNARIHPTLFDIFVALFCGLIGAYSYVNKRVSSAIPGVAISVALMPPLCTVGIGLGLMRWDMALGAGLLFGINLTGISLSALVVFYLVRLHPQSENQKEFQKAKLRALGQFILTSCLLLFISFFLIYFTLRAAEDSLKQDKILKLIEKDIGSDKIFSFKLKEAEKKKIELIVLGAEIPKQIQTHWQKNLEEILGSPVKLNIFVISGIPSLAKKERAKSFDYLLR